MDKQAEMAVIAAVEMWAKQHPNPDGIAIQMADGREYSPMQIVTEIREHTPMGKTLLKVVEQGAERFSLTDGFAAGRHPARQ